MAPPTNIGANRLPVLAAEIAAGHGRCTAARGQFVAHAVATGNQLLEAKAIIGHGGLGDWLALNVPGLSVRTAQRYMQAATRAKSATVAHSTLTALVAPEHAAVPRPIWEECSPERMAYLFTEWPDILGTSVHYLAADDHSDAEIADLLQQDKALVTAHLAPPPVMDPTAGDHPGNLAAVNHAIAMCWFGMVWATHWRTVEWAERYGRPDLIKRLRLQQDRAARARDAAADKLAELECAVAATYFVALSRCRELLTLDTAPRDPSLAGRLRSAHAAMRLYGPGGHQ